MNKIENNRIGKKVLEMASLASMLAVSILTSPIWMPVMIGLLGPKNFFKAMSGKEVNNDVKTYVQASAAHPERS